MYFKLAKIHFEIQSAYLLKVVPTFKHHLLEKQKVSCISQFESQIKASFEF